MTFKVHDGVEIDGKSLTNSGGTLSWGGVAVGSGGGVTINSNANNRVLTGDGSNAVAETNLTFDGTNLQIVGSTRGLITEKLRLGATDTSFIERDSTVNIGYRADGVHRFWTYNSSWLERAQITDTGFNLLAGHSYQLGGTTVIDSSRNLTNIGDISSGQVTITQTHPTVFLQESGGGTTNAAYLQKYGNDLYLYNKEANGSLFLGTNNGTKLTINNAGTATFAGTILTNGTTSNSVPKYSFSGDTDTGLGYVGTNAVALIAGGSRKFYVNASNAFFQNLTGGVSVPLLSIGSTTVIDASRQIQNATLKATTTGTRFQVNAWHYDTNNDARFYFEANGRTYYRSDTGHHFRANGDVTRLNISSTGAINIGGSDTQVTGTAVLAVANTVVLDTSRNLTNIGRIVANGGGNQHEFTSSSDGPIITKSTDATTGVGFTDNSATNYLFYRGSLNHFYFNSGTVGVGVASAGSGQVLNVAGGIGISSTTVIDSSRNLTDISGIYFPNANSRIYGGSSHRALEAHVDGSQLQVGEGYGLINLFKTQNGVNQLKLHNNRQDLGNVGVSKVSGFNGVEVANMTFYRGGGGSSGFIRFQNKPTNASSLTDVFQVGDGATVGYGVNIIAGGLRIANTTVIDASRNLTNIGTINSGVITATGGNSTNWNTAFGWGNHASASYATQSYVGTQISNLVDSSPAALNTLNELAAALGDDANFSTTVNTNIAAKLPLAGGTMTGTLNMNTNAIQNANLTGAATYLPGHAYSNTHDGTNVYWHIGSASGSTNKQLNLRIYNSSNAYVLNTWNTSGLSLYGNLSLSGTVDGRDVAADGTKLDGIAASANNYSFPYTISTSSSNNTVVRRDGSGYIFGSYLNMTGTFANSGAGGTMGYFTGTNGSDNYGRSWTAAQARTLLNVADGATNVTNTNQLTNGAGYITSADGGNATTLDGLDLHTGRNNEVNKVVRTDSNGYIQAGWINTTSGDDGANVPTRIYSSSDGYLRYVDLASFRSRMNVTAKSGYQGREGNTTDTNYWVGSMGYGTTTFDNLFKYGSGSIDTWSNPSDQPSGTSHWVGHQHLHYHQGTYGYGHQEIMGAGSPALAFVRGRWGSGAWGSWFKNWNAANDGAGSGLDADLLDGIGGDGYLRSNANDAYDGTLTMNGMDFKSSNVVRNLKIQASTGGTDVGISGFRSDGTHGFQVYADGSNYGFLDGNWGSWDLKKAKNGQLHVDEGSGLVKVWSAGNDGSGSGLDADTLDGLNSKGVGSATGASQVLTSNTNSYFVHQNWIDIGGSGIYSTSTNGAHFSPNTVTSYGSWKTSGSRGGYDGIVFDGGGDAAIMFDGSGNGGMYRQAGGGWYNYFHVGNNCMGINDSTTSSSYGAYLTGAFYATGDIVGSSDERLKTEIKTIPNALDKVLQLRGVTYKWKEKQEENNITETRMGVIAQEILDIVPEVVTHDVENDRYGVSYGHITGLLIEAIKQQQEQINELKKEIKGE